MLIRVSMAVSFLTAAFFLSVLLLCEPLLGQEPLKHEAASNELAWLPSEAPDKIPALDPSANCNLEKVLQHAGQRIQEFVSNVERFTAREYLLQETISKSGKISGSEKRKYDYLVSINEIRPGILNVEEYLKGSYSPDAEPGGITGLSTKGLPALVLIFHPNYADDFSMKCEGLATVNGQPAWQVSFQQRADRPNRIRSYSFGSNGMPHPVALKGRAWFTSNSYQIVSLRSDLLGPLPGIRLSVDHTAIEYGPVHFSKRGEDLWLPQSAELYSDLKGKRIHQRMNFSEYLLFAVDQSQKIGAPKTAAPYSLLLFFVPLSP
jgi:hypothetical protein